MCFGESTLEAIDYTRSRGRAEQKMNGHATGRDRRHRIRAAKEVSGYVD